MSDDSSVRYLGTRKVKNILRNKIHSIIGSPTDLFTLVKFKFSLFHISPASVSLQMRWSRVPFLIFSSPDTYPMRAV